MKSVTTFFFIIFCVALGTAQNSELAFVIKNLGVGVDGHFETFSITPQFEKDTLTALSGHVQVETIKTGIKARDSHLLEDDYFHQEKYPEISFSSQTIIVKEGGNYAAKIALTIKGTTKTLEIPVEVENTTNGFKLTTQFTINRTDFGVGEGGLILSKSVKINATYYHIP